SRPARRRRAARRADPLAPAPARARVRAFGRRRRSAEPAGALPRARTAAQYIAAQRTAAGLTHMPQAGDLVLPRIPSRRSRALGIAGRASRRRGSGDEIAGSRPYRRGDAIRLIDWAASARLSTARGSDEFVVRDHFAEDAIRVVVVLDRGPTMA